MANTELEAVQGIDMLAFARRYADRGTTEGQLIPYQTSIDFDPQRDSDTTATKSGTVTTSSPSTTDFEVEFVNNFSKIADQLNDSLFDGEKMEFWIVFRKRKNSKGQYYAIYMRGTVSEDEWDGDPDDVSNRDVSFNVEGTPVKGWTDLPTSAKEQLNYVFYGLGAVTDPKNDGTDGGATPYNKSTDAGLNVADVSATTSA